MDLQPLVNKVYTLEQKVERLLKIEPQIDYGTTPPTNNLFHGKRFLDTNYGRIYQYRTDNFLDQGGLSGWYEINSGLTDDFKRGAVSWVGSMYADTGQMYSNLTANLWDVVNESGTICIGPRSPLATEELLEALSYPNPVYGNRLISAQVKGTLATSSPASVPGIVLAFQDANNLILCQINPATSLPAIWKRVGGTYTQMSTGSAVVLPADGTFYTITARLINSTTINLYYNGASAASMTLTGANVDMINIITASAWGGFRVGSNGSAAVLGRFKSIRILRPYPS